MRANKCKAIFSRKPMSYVFRTIIRSSEKTFNRFIQGSRTRKPKDCWKSIIVQMSSFSYTAKIPQRRSRFEKKNFEKDKDLEKVIDSQAKPRECVTSFVTVLLNLQPNMFPRWKVCNPDSTLKIKAGALDLKVELVLITWGWKETYVCTGMFQQLWHDTACQIIFKHGWKD